MKEIYDLKEIINTGLQEVKVNKEIQHKIKEKYESLAQNTYFYGGKKRNKVAVYLAASMLLMYGSVFAIQPFLGFKLFLTSETIEKVSGKLQVIAQSQNKERVTMTVEEAIADGQEALFVFSFTKEGGNTWPDKIEVEKLKLPWMEGYSMRHALSQDNRTLTYYINDGVSKEDALKHTLEISAENFIAKKEVIESVDIALADLYDVLPPINIGNYELDLMDQYCQETYNLIKSKELDSNPYKVLLESRPSSVVQGIDMCGDTLRIVTRSELNTKDKKIKNEKSAIGYVSKIMDTRTGMVYTPSMRNTIYTPEKEKKYAFYFSEFKVKDKEQIKHLKIVEVKYDVINSIQEGKWEVQFNLENQVDSRPIRTNIHLTNTQEDIYIDKVYISSLGIRLEGKAISKINGDISGVPEKDIIVSGTTLKGETIKYQIHWGIQKKDSKEFILSYKCSQDIIKDIQFLEKDMLREIKVQDNVIPIAAEDYNN